MKRITLAVLLGTAALSLTPVASYAQQQSITSAKNQGYLVDRNGNIVKSARTGQCVRLARQWSPSQADKECAATLASQSRR